MGPGSHRAATLSEQTSSYVGNTHQNAKLDNLTAVATAQTNLKRMLAYSTISHVGFILMGFLAPSSAGVEAALFYTVVYVIMSAGAFGMIILLGREGFEADEIDELFIGDPELVGHQRPQRLRGPVRL